LWWRQIDASLASRYRRHPVGTNTIEVANETAVILKNEGYPGYANNLRVIYNLESPPMTRIEVRIIT
jgi:hypothetical protein